jgi:diaminopimelate epimerase
MGRASVTSRDFPGGPPDGLGELSVGGEPAGKEPADGETASGGVWRFQHISIGNPQCSIRVADEPALEALHLPAIGPGIEGNELFPNRTNVSWYAVLESDRPDRSAAGPAGADRIRARIFERGVGETLSSGTGAAGAAVAHLLAGGRCR